MIFFFTRGDQRRYLIWLFFVLSLFLMYFLCWFFVNVSGGGLTFPYFITIICMCGGRGFSIYVPVHRTCTYMSTLRVTPILTFSMFLASSPTHGSYQALGIHHKCRLSHVVRHWAHNEASVSRTLVANPPALDNWRGVSWSRRASLASPITPPGVRSYYKARTVRRTPRGRDIIRNGPLSPIFS